MYIRVGTTIQAGRPKKLSTYQLTVIITWPPFFQYNKRRLRKKNVRDMLVYAPE